MSRISISSIPNDTINIPYWRPGKEGSSNQVVVLSEFDQTKNPNVPSCNSMVRMFKNSKFGPSYPINASYVYHGRGQNDPKDILAPELKLSFLAIVYVGVKVDGEWRLHIWQITSSALYKNLLNIATSMDITGGVIGFSKSGNSWSIHPMPKVVVPKEIVDGLMDSVPPLEDIIAMMNDFETTEEIWNYLVQCSNGEAKNKEELMTLFGVGSNVEML